MAKSRPKTGKRAATQAAGDAGTSAREDRSLVELLRTKSVDRILPEVVSRTEAGRRAYARDGETAVTAELALLAEERARLEAEPDESGRRTQIDRVLAGIEADLESHRVVTRAVARAVQPVKGGWTVVGRAVPRRGGGLRRATIEFVTDNNQIVKELGVLPVDTDGWVQKSYPAELVKELATRRVVVAAALRVGNRVVATDETRVEVAPDRLHQFDLRTDVIE